MSLNHVASRPPKAYTPITANYATKLQKKIDICKPFSFFSANSFFLAQLFANIIIFLYLCSGIINK